MSRLDFDPRTLPWTDRDDFPAELERRREAGTVSDEEAALLEQWRRDGYLRFGGLIEEEEIDRLVTDAERAWTERPRIDINVSDLGILELPAAPPREEIGHHHYRLLDLQDAYETPRRILLTSRLIRFLSLLFDDTPVAMQSLYFEYPSEQEVHQDFPFVQAQILSHLVGCWIACEEVGSANGPLLYYPGSHRLPKYDWGGGSLRLEGRDDGHAQEFSKYLERACADAGLEPRTLTAAKGDALLWHGALAHGGASADDPEATRHTFVVHYSSLGAYPRDRRTPRMRPAVFERNGGRFYLRRRLGPLGRLRSAVGARVRRLRTGG